jgi:hypothetical protein
MKTQNSAIVFLLACSIAYGQTPLGWGTKEARSTATDNRKLTAEEWRLKVVAHLMSLPSPTAGVEFLLYPMGDEAAVDVLKALSAGRAATPVQMQSALEIIHTAFEHPEAILSPMNREPRAAIFLLQHFASTSNDQSLQERISGEVQSLQAVAARSAASGASQAK